MARKKTKPIESENPPDWKTVEFLPKGWRMRETFRIGNFGGKARDHQTKKTYLLHPDGRKFSSWVQALQFVMERSSDTDEIGLIKDGLVHEGWQYHQFLPEGWMVRYQTEFLTNEADVIKGHTKVREYIKKTYEHLYLENFTKYCEELIKSKRKATHNWFEDDTLPKGWKSKSNKSGRKGVNYFMLSPSDEQFASRRMALKFMIENEHSQEDIRFMRDHLGLDGWQEHPLLPPNWKIRVQDQKEDGKLLVDRRVYILTDNAIYFKTFSGLLMHMKEVGNYTEVQMEDINKLMLEEAREARSSAYGWLDDKDLPPGWKKRKLDGGGTCYLSPQGDRCGSKKMMLKSLIDNQYSQELIESMRGELKEEGYVPHTLLPKGWLVKERISLSQNSIEFITQDLEEVNSIKQAREKLKISSLYDHMDRERFEIYVTETTKEMAIKKHTWVNDDTLPVGWKMRSSDTKVLDKEYFLSPDQDLIPNRRMAYAFMIKQGYCQSDLDRMRISLTVSDCHGNSWLENDLLPSGWLYRETVDHGKQTYFLNTEGEELKNIKAAITYLEKEERYSKADMDKMKRFLASKAKMRIALGRDWKTSHTVPIGWKVRNRGAKKWILSPEGQQFRTRKAGLQHMINSSHPVEVIKEMRGFLIHEGWKSFTNLPHGWMFRELPGKTVVFLTSSGEEFTSGFKALDYAKTKGGCSEEELLKLKAFNDDEALQSRRLANTIKAFESHSQGWVEDMTISHRWKTKLSENSRHGKQYFMAPSGEEFSSKLRVLQHMLKKSFPREEIDSVKQTLITSEGWQEDTMLPSGWMFKDSLYMDVTGTRISTHTTQILSVEGELFNNYKKALVFMVESQEYHDGNILGLNQLTEKLAKDRREMKTDWKETNSLPSGWKVISDGIRQVFISPGEDSFNSRRECLVYMISNNNYTVDDVEKMRASLKLDGWLDSGFLPPNWRYKKTGEQTDENGTFKFYNHKFCTDDGRLISNIEDARIVLQNDVAHLESLDMFWSFESKKKADGKRREYNWKEGDASVPQGWKMRQGGKTPIGGKNKPTSLLSTYGMHFLSRRAALQYIIRDESAEKTSILEMRTMISVDGWRPSHNLPEGWLQCNKNSARQAQTVILTREGNLFNSYKDVLDFMKSLPYYTEAEQKNLRIVMEKNKCEDRISTLGKSSWISSLTVPKKWKVKKRKNKIHYLLSPDGKQLEGRRKALHYMVLNNFPLEEVEEMRSLLKHDGWEEDDHLPQGWRVWRKSRHTRHRLEWEIRYLTEKGERLTSQEKVLQHINDNSKYSQEDLDKVLKLFEEKINNTKRNRKPMIGKGVKWEHDTKLPEGWQSRSKMKSKRPEFRSPDGQTFPSYSGAYLYMLSKGCPPDQVEIMRELVKLEGYEEDGSLPAGWMMRFFSPTSMSILSSEGQEFTSFKSAVAYLENEEGYDEENLEDLRMLRTLKTRKAKKMKHGL